MPQSFPPVYDCNSRILILGTMPSVQSRSKNFYYAHPTNRFWSTVGEIFGEKDLRNFDITAKIDFLQKNHIALWDVCAYCEIESSRDSTIKDVVPNDLNVVFNAAKIDRIFFNGQTAANLYKKHFASAIVKTVALPSTSAANVITADKYSDFVNSWSVIKDYLSKEDR